MRGAGGGALTLAVIPTPNTQQVSLCSYLLKRRPSGLVKGWKKRWFVLRGDHIYYYKKQGDDSPLGAIYCADIFDVTRNAGEMNMKLSPNRDSHTLRLKDVGQKGEHAFNIITPDRTYQLWADTEELRNYWVDGTQIIISPLNPDKNLAI